MASADLSPEFFFDLVTVKQFNRGEVEQLRGHRVLLSVEEHDSLQLSALIDGSTIDFLFGVKRNTIGSALRKRADTVKSFVRHLSTEKQYAAVNFYKQLYDSVQSYHEMIASYSCLCYYCLVSRADVHFRREVEDAFNKLYFHLYGIKRISS